MERKRLFAVGVDGAPRKENVPEDVVWTSAGKQGGAFVFGVRERSEDDAERALRFSLSFVDSPHRATVKYVSVDIDGKNVSLDWDKEILPELKRLETGEASVTPDLAKIYARLFVFEPVEDEKELFLIRGDRRRPARTRGLTARYGKLIGRKTELERLAELVQQIQEDQGQVVALTGAPGIGKTRLKMALRETLQQKGVECYEGAYQFRNREPYQGFRQIVRDMVESKGSRLDALGVTLAELDYLELLTKPEKIPEHLKGVSDEDLKKGLFFAVRKSIHRAARNPLVLIFEDLHWADTGTLELLEYVMEEMEKTKLLLLLVHRPEVQGGWTKRLNYTSIDLKPFAAGELEAFVKDISSVDRIPRPVVSMLESVSLGNPLFVEEMLRNLLEAKALEIQTLDNEEKLLGGKTLKASDVPSTIHSLVASRFDRLPASTKEALRWAAVLGSTFSYDEYLGILQEELKENAEEEVRRLQNHRYLEERAVFPVHQLAFSHDVIQAVVLENIAEEEGRRIHRKVAESLSTQYPSATFETVTRIADHYLHGDDPQRAVEEAVKAGEMALAIFRLNQAEYFLSGALKRWKETAVNSVSPHRIYQPLTHVLAQVADLKTASGMVEEWGSHDVVSDARVQAAYATQLMRVRTMENRHEEANEAALMALQAFDALGDISEAKYRLVGEHLLSLRRTGRLAEAITELKGAIAEMGSRFPEVRAALLAGVAVVATRMGDREEAQAYVDQAVATLPNDASVVNRIHFSRILISAYEYLQMHPELKKIYDAVVEGAREMGMRHSHIELLMLRASNANEMGEYTLSFRDLEEVGVAARQMKNANLAEWSSLCVVDNLLDLGAISEAVEKWQVFTAEFPRPAEAVQEGRRAMVASAMAEHRRDYLTALLHRQQGAAIYRRLGDLVTTGRAEFRILKYKVLTERCSVDEAVREFNRMASGKDEIHVPYWQYARHETAYFLASKGGHPSPGPDLQYDPLTECPCAYFRQYLAVAKISWLNSAGRKKEALELCDRYRADRERMKEKIPSKYHRVFDDHPSYRVPSL